MGEVPPFDLFEELHPSSLKSNQSVDLDSILIPYRQEPEWPADTPKRYNLILP